MIEKKVFIVGVDSQLGSALYTFLKKSHIDVFGSTRRIDIGNRHSYIDLNRPHTEWDVPKQLTDVVIFSSITSQEYCETNPEESNFVNVEQTSLLLDRVGKMGSKIIFPSSNLVLPCVTPNQKSDLLKKPMSQYALQKAKIEDFLSESNYKYQIVRLSKVLNSKLGIIAEWQKSFTIGKEITPFHDLMISPISIQYCTKVLFKLLFSENRGIYQLTGESEFSYAELSKEIAKRLDIYGDIKIKPQSVNHLEFNNIIKPMHPSLDGSRVEKEFKVAPQTMSELIDDLLSEITMQK